MKKLSKAFWVLTCLILLAAGYGLYNQTIITKQAKEIKILKSQISNLEEENEEHKEKIDELEDQLADVQHFDNDAVVRRGYSSGGSGNVAFTGNVYQGKIDGEFEGWEGETIFKMMDGSIWQQASYAYTYHYAYMPRVIIYSKGSGTFMKVEDVDDVIAVKRLN